MENQPSSESVWFAYTNTNTFETNTNTNMWFEPAGRQHELEAVKRAVLMLEVSTELGLERICTFD